MLDRFGIPLPKQCDPWYKYDLHATIASGFTMMMVGLSLQDMERLWERTTRDEVDFTVIGFDCVKLE